MRLASLALGTLATVGLAAGSASAQYVAAPPVYVAPPVVVAPPAPVVQVAVPGVSIGVGLPLIRVGPAWPVYGRPYVPYYHGHYWHR